MKFKSKIIISLFVFFMLINTFCLANNNEKSNIEKFEIKKIITLIAGIFLVVQVLFISYKKDLQQEKIEKELIDIEKEIKAEEIKRKTKEEKIEEANLFLEMKENKQENKIETVAVESAVKQIEEKPKKATNKRKNEEKKKGKTSDKK